MATVIKHHSVKIVVLDAGEEIGSTCGAGDIAIVTDAEGWWLKFVGEDGHVDCYGEPYSTYSQALGSAKAAAEVGT